MDFDNGYVRERLKAWERYIDDYHLPRWEDIPDFGLYMDQVVQYLKSTLDYLPPDIKEEQFITPATINNYVSRHIIPKPVKKKYFRKHLAFLIFLCSLKRSLSTSLINNIVPFDEDEASIEKAYREYVKIHELATSYFKKQVSQASTNILNPEVDEHVSVTNTTELLLASAIVSGFSRLLAEKLILIEGKKTQ